MTRAQKRVVVILGVVVVAVVVVVWFVKSGEVLSTTIRLSMSGGTCGIPDNVGAVRAKNGHEVVFHVKNDCADRYVVRLGNFQPKDAGPANDNVLTGAKTVVVGPGATADIKGNADRQGQTSKKTYKYTIFMRRGSETERVGQDPDFEIWP